MWYEKYSGIILYKIYNHENDYYKLDFQSYPPSIDIAVILLKQNEKKIPYCRDSSKIQ